MLYYIEFLNPNIIYFNLTVEKDPYKSLRLL